jgi:hypothetical protein
MRASGGTVGTGGGVAVSVGVGGTAGVDVADGIGVDPKEKGRLLQAVRANAITSPNRVRRSFMGVLILVNGGGVNGRNLHDGGVD